MQTPIDMTSEVKGDSNNLLLQQAGVILIPPVVGATSLTSYTNDQHQQQFNAAVEAAQQPPMTEEMKEVKRRERLEQNRLSACESRKRKKTMIEELQRSVINLSRENKELQNQNEMIKHQLLDLGAKFPNSVPLHLLSTDQQFQPQAHSIDPTQQQNLPPLQDVPPVAVTPTNIVTQVAPALDQQQQQTQFNTQQHQPLPAPVNAITNIPTQQPASFPNFMTTLTETATATPGTMQQQLQQHIQAQQELNFANMHHSVPSTGVQNNIGSNISALANTNNTSNSAHVPSSV